MFMGILCRICHCFAGNSGEDEPSVQPPDDAAGEERTEAAPKARGGRESRRRTNSKRQCTESPWCCRMI